MRVLFPVTSCNSYLDRQRLTLHEMQEIAFVLRADPRRNQAGLVHASKLPDDERFVLDDD